MTTSRVYYPRCKLCGLTHAVTVLCRHRWPRRKKKRYEPKFWEVIKNVKERAKAEGNVSGIPGKGMLEPYPSLWEMLTADKYDTGKKRRRSSFLCIMDGPVCKILLMDKDTGEQAWIAAESIDQCLDQADQRIADGTMPWQPSPYAGGRGGKRP